MFNQLGSDFTEETEYYNIQSPFPGPFLQREVHSENHIYVLSMARALGFDTVLIDSTRR